MPYIQRNSPFKKKEEYPVIEKKLDKGVIAEANKDGTIFVSKDVSPVVQKHAIKEEIEHQKDMIDLTKAECALIQVSTSTGGTQSFDLPSNLKRQKGTDRPRKDSYSALVLGNWGMNIYYDMMDIPEESNQGFTPMFI